MVQELPLIMVCAYKDKKAIPNGDAVIEMESAGIDAVNGLVFLEFQRDGVDFVMSFNEEAISDLLDKLIIKKLEWTSRQMILSDTLTMN